MVAAARLTSSHVLGTATVPSALVRPASLNTPLWTYSCRDGAGASNGALYSLPSNTSMPSTKLSFGNRDFQESVPHLSSGATQPWLTSWVTGGLFGIIKMSGGFPLRNASEIRSAYLVVTWVVFFTAIFGW